MLAHYFPFHDLELVFMCWGFLNGLDPSTHIFQKLKGDFHSDWMNQVILQAE